MDEITNNPSDKTRKVGETLDVESDEQRLHRIQTTLEKLNKPSVTYSGGGNSFPTLNIGEKRTYMVEPPNELLARVQAFLPQIEASNAVLSQKVRNDPRSVDIEHIKDDDAQVIQMTLGLGVFEHRKMVDVHSVSPTTTSSSQDDEVMSMSMSTSSDSDSDDSSDVSDDIITSFPISRPIKPLPRRGVRPVIMVLDEHLPSIEK